MSTLADCKFIEVEPGKWIYKIQDWPYGEWPEYETNGPFNSYSAAEKHLDENYANPGGHSVRINKDNHIHEKGKVWLPNSNEQTDGCVSCGVSM